MRRSPSSTRERSRSSGWSPPELCPPAAERSSRDPSPPLRTSNRGFRPVRIVVLVKPVPDTASGGERLRPSDWRLDRAATPHVVNANDEYALESALKLTEAHGGEVHLVSMAGANAPETMRKALAMGVTSGTLVTDEALGGSDIVSTTRVLAAAVRDMEFDLLLAGADTS